MLGMRFGGISAVETGEGPPLVLLHSLLSDHASFAGIAPALARQFRVFTLDLPGFGRSSPVTGGIAAIADSIADFVRKISDGQKAILLGNGFGAFLALQLAIQHPDLVDRLVLAGCGARFSDPGREAFRTMAHVAQTKGLAAIADTAMRRLFAPDFQAAHPDLMNTLRASFLGMDLAVFREACAALAALDLSGDAASMTVPTMILAGEQDEATPPAMAQELATIVPDARMVLLPGCAHVPQLQAPDRFLDAVAPFLGMDVRQAV